MLLLMAFIFLLSLFCFLWRNEAEECRRLRVDNEVEQDINDRLRADLARASKEIKDKSARLENLSREYQALSHQLQLAHEDLENERRLNEWQSGEVNLYKSRLAWIKRFVSTETAHASQ